MIRLRGTTEGSASPQSSPTSPGVLNLALVVPWGGRRGSNGLGKPELEDSAMFPNDASNESIPRGAGPEIMALSVEPGGKVVGRESGALCFDRRLNGLKELKFSCLETLRVN